MLLIDGVEYDLQTPANEDEFERVVEEHAQDIFGLNAIYVNRKQKLRSFSGIVSIPDGYAIDVDADRWHVVEVELSSHPLHEHIISQLGRFINGIKNPSTQRQIVAAIYEEIEKDRDIRECLEASLESKEIYKYLSDLIAEPPILTIVIDNSTQELEEAVASLAHPEIKIVEFRTFFRARAGPGARWEGSADHVHLFEPLGETLKLVEERPRRHGVGKTYPLSTSELLAKYGDRPSKVGGMTWQQLYDSNDDGNFRYFKVREPLKELDRKETQQEEVV